MTLCNCDEFTQSARIHVPNSIAPARLTLEIDGVSWPLILAQDYQSIFGITNGGAVRLKVNPDGVVEVPGTLRAANEMKVWDSGWFAISSNQAIDLNHNLGALPKGVTVYCGNNVNPVPGNPSIANSLFVDTSGASNELGCYVARVNATSLRVRARSYIGINEADNGLLTSGAYKVIAWA